MTTSFRMTYKCRLPLLALIVTATLLLVADQRPPASWRVPAPPEILWAYSINAPATLIRRLTESLLSRLLDPRIIDARVLFALETIAFFAAVAVLWAIIGVMIDDKGKKETRMVTGNKTIRRVGVDLTLMAAGVLMALMFLASWSTFARDADAWSQFSTGPWLLWSIAIVCYFGRDLLRLIKRKVQERNTPADLLS